MIYSKVLWSNCMTLCIGLKSELDEEEFMEQLVGTHEDLTGDPIYVGDGIITTTDELVWIFKLH